MWKARIDHDTERICGLQKFMEFYEIKLYNLMMFDFFGKDLFLVKIFRNTAIECNYVVKNLDDYFKYGKSTRSKEEEYIFDLWSPEYDRSRALWSFSASRNSQIYFEIIMKKNYVDGNN